MEARIEMASATGGFAHTLYDLASSDLGESLSHPLTGRPSQKARLGNFYAIDRTGHGHSHECRQVEHSSLPLSRQGKISTTGPHDLPNFSAPKLAFAACSDVPHLEKL